jgi:hypothetical protein
MRIAGPALSIRPVVGCTGGGNYAARTVLKREFGLPAPSLRP